MVDFVCKPPRATERGTFIDFDGHCAAISRQATLFAGHLDGADVTAPVSSCPGWNVSQLSRHVEGGLRWAHEIVTTLASAPPPDTALRDLSQAAGESSSELARAVLDSATALVDALRAAGPDAQMWCPVDGGG